jgi:hypothetical protein
VTVLGVVVQPRYCWYTAEHGKTKTVKEDCLAEVQRLGVTDCLTSTYLVNWVDQQLDRFEEWREEAKPTGNPTNPWLAVDKEIKTLSQLRAQATLRKATKRDSVKKEKEKKESSERVRNQVSWQCFVPSTLRLLCSTRTR